MNRIVPLTLVAFVASGDNEAFLPGGRELIVKVLLSILIGAYCVVIVALLVLALLVVERSEVNNDDWLDDRLSRPIKRSNDTSIPLVAFLRSS